MNRQSNFLCLLIFLCGQTAMAQIAEPITQLRPQVSSVKSVAKSPALTNASADELTVYYSEDFSNGFSGSGENGGWSFSGEHGTLWFTTFPLGSPNGYDPLLALNNASPLYGNLIPNYFEQAGTIDSPTASNGFAMIDMDRFNSTTVEGEQPNTNGFLEESIDAILISPKIDLTGVTRAELTFEQSIRLCCTAFFAQVQISTNGGYHWTGYDVFSSYGGGNDYIRERISINLIPLLAGVQNLSSVYIRFVIGGGSVSHYYWMIDDLKITAQATNDLAAGESWYNDYPLFDPYTNPESSVLNYYQNFEYLEMPIHSVHPLDFGLEVKNKGYMAQHNVKLEATIHFPNGNTTILHSEPAQIAAGTSDTLWINDVDLTDFNDFSAGEYTIDYLVTQLEPEQTPFDNSGISRTFSITKEELTEDIQSYPTIRNDEDSYDVYYANYAANVIWGVPYTFADAHDGTVQITHIETVFINTPTGPHTDSNIPVFFNVRIGSMLDQDYPSTVVFDSEKPLTYDAENLRFLIEAEDIWQASNNTTEPFHWVSFELPEPITVNANTIYQAEVRIPPSGYDVYLPVTKNSEKYSAVLYQQSYNNWFYLGTNSLPIRFRTSQTCPDTIQISQVACNSYTFHGETYTQSGLYDQTVTTEEGCEILYKLNLTINEGENTTSEIEISSCDSTTYNGETFSQTGIYTQTQPNSQGCDSIVTINYTRLEPTFASLYINGCGSAEYQGITFTKSTTLQYKLTNAAGCDSILQLNVEIFDELEPTFLAAEACSAYTLNGITYTESGIYTQEYQGINGCDSIIQLLLFILGPGNQQCATVSGIIDFSGTCKNREVDIYFYLSGTSTFVQHTTAVTDDLGQFFSSDITPGIYDIYIKPWGHLQKKYSDITLSAGIQQLIMGNFISSDVNNDNKVNVTDISCVNVCFGTTIGNAGYLPNIDINCDGMINIQDFSLINIGFGTCGIDLPLAN